MLAQINSSFVDGILCSSGGVDRMIQLQGTYLGAIELRTLNTHRFLFRLPKLLSRWRRQSHSRTYPLSMKLNIPCGVTIRRPVTGKNTSEGARL